MRPNPSRRTPRAFSLIELLCVMGILLVLFALSFGVGGRDRQRVRQEECRANLMLVHQALRIAATDHAERYPATNGAASSDVVLQGLVPRYSSRVDIFRCPGRTRDPFTGGSATTKHFRNHFAYAMGRTTADGAEDWLLSDEQVDTRPKRPGDPLFADKDDGIGSNHGAHGGSALFCDGHAEASPPRAKFAVSLPPGGAILNPRH
jgi:prepilin-type N-terminal cleavage/methylation domain-containing protein